MSSAVRCLRCEVLLAPFGGRDLATVVVDHLRNVHGQFTAPTLHPGGAA